MNNKIKGFNGEKLATKFLKDNQYKILANNFRGHSGEIDIIAMKKNNLVFVEVKTWDKYKEDSLDKVINNTKRKRMIDTAKYFLMNNEKYYGKLISFDIIFIKNNLKDLLHIKDAFGDNYG